MCLLNHPAVFILAAVFHSSFQPHPSHLFPLPSLFNRHSSPFLTSKEDEVGGTELRGEVERLHEERNMLLETIKDLKQTVEQTASLPELDTKVMNDWAAPW